MYGFSVSRASLKLYELSCKYMLFAFNKEDHEAIVQHVIRLVFINYLIKKIVDRHRIVSQTPIHNISFCKHANRKRAISPFTTTKKKHKKKQMSKEGWTNSFTDTILGGVVDLEETLQNNYFSLTNSLRSTISVRRQDARRNLIRSLDRNRMLHVRRSLTIEEIETAHVQSKIFRPLLDLLLYNETSRCYFLFCFCLIDNVTIRENILSSLLILLHEVPENAAVVIENLISFDQYRPDSIKQLKMDRNKNDSPSQRLLKLYNRMYGGAYLEAVFDGVMDNFRSFDENVTDVTTIVLELTTLLVHNVAASVDVLPSYLRQICIQIAKHSKQDNQGYMLYVSNVIFRHFLCPAIIFPENFRLWNHSEAPNEKQRSILVAISKLFIRLLPNSQKNIDAATVKLASTVVDGERMVNMYSKEIAEFVETFRPIIEDFIVTISSEIVEEKTNAPTPPSPLHYNIPEMMNLHRNLADHFCYFPVLDDFEHYSEVSHVIRTLEIIELLKNARTREQYVQICQKLGKIVLPIVWIKTQMEMRSDLNSASKIYNFVSEKQIAKDIARDIIYVNNKEFKNYTNLWDIVSYMVGQFQYSGTSRQTQEHLAISILQKTGRTNGGGDSYDAAMLVFGANEHVLIIPDTSSTYDYPQRINIRKEGPEVIIESTQKNFYKISERHTYHEKFSVWFKLSTTVRWKFNLSKMLQNVVDMGQVIFEPDHSLMEPHMRILVAHPVSTDKKDTEDNFLVRLQKILYDIEIKERERVRAAQFKRFIKLNTGKD